MKSDYIVRAYKFIEQFFPYFENCRNLTDYACAARMFSYEHKRKVACASGLSRVAFITADYVIKFDYNINGSREYGGCKDEIKFYQFAKEHGFGKLFAEITMVHYHGYDFYIMPRINGVGKYSDCWVEEFLTDDELDFVNTYLYDMHDENYGWKNHHPVIIDYALNTFFIEEKNEREEVMIG